ENGIDLSLIQPRGAFVQKDDVLAYLAAQAERVSQNPASPTGGSGRTLASPKARRLASERGLSLAALSGSGPDGAVLAADVLAAPLPSYAVAPSAPAAFPVGAPGEFTVGRTWQVMVERLTQAWTSIPHFYLTREVDAGALLAWREEALQRLPAKTTVSDLLVKLAAIALQQHPRLNATWREGSIVPNAEINVGLAVAVDEGLVVPVIHRADQLGLGQIAARRQELVGKAQKSRLLFEDISGGTFTLSNLGMYGVDGFNAIVNPPQAAILAVGRIADRVVAVNKQPAVRPMLTLTLSCDHRVADGARAARFLQTLAELIQEPLRVLD
ncbi:MAG: 2-oxo acid dehydrogenase subunit E2, partial [Chloroflexi bacterium]|nr:2-oxo acid dehydrogenase subunit E2 [Chloroflexota bacterium]